MPPSRLPLVCAFLLLPALSGCGSQPLVLPDPRVSLRDPTAPADQALVLLFDPSVCSVTLHDHGGKTFDRQSRDGASGSVDMTRAVPDAPWEAVGNRVLLMLALAMPPGHYTLVGYSTAEDPERARSPEGRPIGYTRCERRTQAAHRVSLPFEVESGQVRLLELPGSEQGIDDLARLELWEGDPGWRRYVGGWLPGIAAAAARLRAERVARLREPRDGYDVYPRCGLATAVVRTTGTSLFPPDTGERHPGPSLWPPVPRSMHGSGIRTGCVTGERSLGLLMSDPGELEAITRRIGEWLSREDRKGEIDIAVSEPFGM